MGVRLAHIKFGVELEVQNLTCGELAEVVANVLGVDYDHDADDSDTCVVDHHGREWWCKYDGSVGSHGSELATPPLMLGDLPTLLRIVQHMNNAGATDDSDCGLHIHVDAAGMTPRQILNLVNLVYAYEGHIYDALGVYEDRKEEYASPYEDYVLNGVRNVAKAVCNEPNVRAAQLRIGEAPYSRYHGLNLRALRHHGTVEFRYFNSTLSTENITAYVHFVLALMAFARTKRTVAERAQRTVVQSCARFDFRCFLVRLGLNGAEYEKTRDVLTQNLPGNGRRAVGRTCTPEQARVVRRAREAMACA